MANLSSNCLFHFTKKKNLINILTEKRIYSSYCKEYVLMDSFIGVPMISFCDIPLKETSKNLKYGKYAIGFKREWAIRNKLNPVLYINENSHLSNFLTDASISSTLYKMKSNKFRDNYWLDKSKLKANPESMIEIAAADSVFSFNNYIQCYMKNTDAVELDGKLKRNQNYRYYDEREWRYVPLIEENIMLFLNETEYMNWRGKAKIKPKLESHYLEFTIDDIEHIVLGNQSDLLNLLENNKISGFKEIQYKFEFIDKIKENF